MRMSHGAQMWSFSGRTLKGDTTNFATLIPSSH